MTAETFSQAPQHNNYPSNVSSMYDRAISIETYLVGAGTVIWCYNGSKCYNGFSLYI